MEFDDWFFRYKYLNRWTEIEANLRLFKLISHLINTASVCNQRKKNHFAYVWCPQIIRLPVAHIWKPQQKMTTKFTGFFFFAIPSFSMPSNFIDVIRYFSGLISHTLTVCFESMCIGCVDFLVAFIISFALCMQCDRLTHFLLAA